MTPNRRDIERNARQQLKDFLNGLSEEDLIEIENGTKTIKFRTVKSRSKTKYYSEYSNYENISALFSKLDEFSDRQTASEFVESLNLSKVELTKFAKSNDIHIDKSDKYEDIVGKIVDNTVGYRLRSAAIRG